MSRRPISLSPDLKRLQDEGYDLQIVGGHLLVKQVPFVDHAKTIQRGTLVCPLDLAGDRTVPPADHVALFAGAQPCLRDGKPYASLVIGTQQQTLAGGTVVHFTFSQKPRSGKYSDFHEKMTTYIAILGAEAAAVEPAATAKVFPPIPADESTSVFNYVDTASSRAGISALSEKLASQKVAIVGLGGSGGYVLDFVAKTPVREIHLFDTDAFLQHNAFRAPGAPSLAELQARPTKIAYLGEIYSRMHRGIVQHPHALDAGSVAMLDGFSYVFVCVDSGPARKPILEYLVNNKIPFADLGMGLIAGAQGVLGVVRVAGSATGQSSAEIVAKRISFAEDAGNDDYKTNIQVAELNALSAVLAVIRWKKQFGFYADLEREACCAYSVDGNAIANERL